MTRFRFYIVLLLACLILPLPASAQRHEILDDNIRSLTVTANDDWQSLPLITLGEGQIRIGFDDMTHEYHRYAYRIEHCEADWKPSVGLFDSDVVEGFIGDNVIDDWQESILTNTLYTHYEFTLPNDRCRPKLSGNYRVTVYDANDEDHAVLTACFMVVEPEERAMGVGLNIVTNTDATINTAHQQVEMEVGYGPWQVTDPSSQIHTVVLQNRRWDDVRYDAKPQYVMNDGLRWSHCRDFIFFGGNEYHKFEILSTDVATLGIDRIEWDGAEYHAYPFVSLPRPNYTYDEDANGAFLLRNEDYDESSTTSDYMTVHFQLQCPEPVSGDVFVNGDFTQDRFLDKYRMEYDAQLKRYHCELPLKLGYYSYQYVMLQADGLPTVMPTEGSFYQTENSYQALVYFREQGGRTDRLVGWRDVTFRKN